jgi:hypothetical protein
VAKHTNKIVEPFDFSQALRLSLPQRFSHSLDRARSIIAASDYQDISNFPCVPEQGGSEVEISQRESILGRPLPPEYRAFLSICRYLKIDDGCEIGGLPHDGIHVAAVPWISDEHRPGTSYLVFANYWRFADGDQLMFDLSDPDYPVVAYLHEHGPLYELYAPSFSLALWRLVHEIEFAS